MYGRRRNCVSGTGAVLWPYRRKISTEARTVTAGSLFAILHRSFVRHEPNLASGGRVTDTDVEEFLNRTGSSPENLALQALLKLRR